MVDSDEQGDQEMARGQFLVILNESLDSIQALKD